MYKEEREKLIAQAESLIAAHKADEANVIVKQIEELDTKHREEAEAKANLDAIRNEPRRIPLAAASLGTVAGNVAASAALFPKSVESGNDRDSDDYRRDFMAFVTRGVASESFRAANEVTKTGDIGAVIPTTIVHRIVEKMETVGKLWARVTKTAYAGGVSVPKSAVKPAAKWVAESKTAETQKKPVGSVTFSYHKLICKVAVSFEVSVVSLDLFEARIADNIAEAMVKQLELSILSGTGSGQPKGILAEMPEEGQKIELAAADKLTFSTLAAAEAALPQAYDDRAVWVMTKPTFVRYIIGMTDSNKRPILREVIGTNGKPQYYILGREVVVVDSSYIVNVNYDVTMREYIDEDTDDRVKKALMLADGKAVDTNSLVTVVKKAGAAS